MPAWMADLTDMEVIFPHYVNYMEQFEDTRGKRRTLYLNHDGTGEYVWKKDELIDLTFPQVLDKHGRVTSPTSTASSTPRSTTRAPTRSSATTWTRSPARSCRMGVQARQQGGHLGYQRARSGTSPSGPTTKIGAVLVTVNTAYKIHEAEYLLRQSDTHTLVMIDGCRLTPTTRQIINELCPEIAQTKPGEPAALQAPALPAQRHHRRLPTCPAA